MSLISKKRKREEDMDRDIGLAESCCQYHPFWLVTAKIWGELFLCKGGCKKTFCKSHLHSQDPPICYQCAGISQATMIPSIPPGLSIEPNNSCLPENIRSTLKLAIR